MIPSKLLSFNNFEDCDITTPDILGPFYPGNYSNLFNITPFDISDKSQNFLEISGTVYASDCKTPIPNATVEIWHANQGEYNIETNEYLGSQYDENFYRGQINTDNFGNYSFLTVLPGKYLNGSYYRPSHIHYKISYLNTELITQIYFAGDTSISLDPWASSENALNRIIPLFENSNNILNGVFDLTLNILPEEISNTSLHENNRLIKSIWPNPINKNTTIILNNFEKNTQIIIYDINGNLVAHQTVLQSEIKLIDIIKKPLKRGLYLLHISNNKGNSEIKKFII